MATSEAMVSSPLPPVRVVLPVKYSSSTGWSMPNTAKTCAAR